MILSLLQHYAYSNRFESSFFRTISYGKEPLVQLRVKSNLSHIYYCEIECVKTERRQINTKIHFNLKVLNCFHSIYVSKILAFHV